MNRKNIINKPWQKWTCEKGHRMEKRDKSDIRSQISEADDKLGPLKNLNGPSLLCGFPSLCWNSSFKTIVNALQLFSYANEWNWALTVKKHSAQQPEFFFFFNTYAHTQNHINLFNLIPNLKNSLICTLWSHLKLVLSPHSYKRN